MDEPVLFNGFQITKDSLGSMTLNTKQYLTDVFFSAINKDRRLEVEPSVTQPELTDYKRLYVELNWLRSAVLP